MEKGKIWPNSSFKLSRTVLFSTYKNNIKYDWWYFKGSNTIYIVKRKLKQVKLQTNTNS